MGPIYRAQMESLLINTAVSTDVSRQGPFWEAGHTPYIFDSPDPPRVPFSAKCQSMLPDERGCPYRRVFR